MALKPVVHVDDETLANENFRKVLNTTDFSQLVVMSLLPSEDIGEEVHKKVQQLIKIEKGTGSSYLNGVKTLIKEGDFITIQPGTVHNIINESSSEPMKLYTIYIPPHHRIDAIHPTKADAEADTQDYPPEKSKRYATGSYVKSVGCGYCGVKSASLYCGKCRKKRYCSQQCSSMDWPSHRKVCGECQNRS